MIDLRLLQKAIADGIIDESAICEQIRMKEKEKILKRHPYKVTFDGTFWKTYVADDNNKYGRKLLKRKDREKLDNDIVDWYKAQEKVVTLTDVFNLWVDERITYNEIEPSTYERYKVDFKKFFMSRSIASMKIQDITDLDLDYFLKDLMKNRDVTSKGFANMRTVLLGTFRYAKKHKYTNINIRAYLDETVIPRRMFKHTIMREEDNVFQEKEVIKIREWITKNGNGITDLGILLVFETGLRAGEIATLEWEDYKGNTLIVRKTESRRHTDDEVIFDVKEHTKGRDGIRTVVLTKRAIEILEEVKQLNPNGKYIFEKNENRMLGSYFSKRLKRVCKYVEINPRSLHKIRKTYATELLDAGIPEKIIISQMGHTNINTTKNYYYYNNKTVEYISNEIEKAMSY